MGNSDMVTIPRWAADIAVAAINFMENPTTTMARARSLIGEALAHPLPKGEAPEIPSQGSPGTREAGTGAPGVREGEASVIWALVNEHGAVANPTPVEPLPGNPWEGGKQWRYQRFIAASVPDNQEGKASPGRECWVLWDDQRKPRQKVYAPWDFPAENIRLARSQGWEWVRMVEAGNQEGKEGK